MTTQNGKRALSILLTLILILSLFPVSVLAADTAWAKDLDGHWAAPDMETLHTYGIMNGDGKGYFMPDREITRAEFVTLINSAFSYDALSVPELTGYTDIPAGIWYADHMKTAIALGFITGYGGGIAAPQDIITREQAAVLLVRLFNAIHMYLDINLPTMLDLPHLPSVFTDYEQISSWAFNGVASAYALGIMRGIGNNHFSPRGDFTIQQSIVAILRVFDMLTAHKPTNGTPNAPTITAGITMNISSYTASGLSFQFENLTELELLYGEAFALYTLVNGVWEPIVPITDDYWEIPDVAYIVAPNSSTEERAVSWTWMFGELPSGYYRFQKEILFYHHSGDVDRVVLESDFTLQ
ncbi:MAG: S-layer homology domain-containing protein [Defluviitaleaceae bacterium]|nr:S-layer homology domain-containing protein [Defluviitaleaceae bacterium]